MTTIAYRDGVVAADTGITQNGSQVARTVKIRRNSAGDVAGATGECGWAASFLRWFVDGEKGDAPEILTRDDHSDRAKGVIFRANGKMYVYESGGVFELTAPYYATGSGRCEALGAMFAGATAEEAVRASIALDSDTFGDITVLRLGEVAARLCNIS